MTIRHTVTVQPAEEPLSTAEAKAQLRWTHSSEDSLVDTYVAAARQMLERLTRRAFILQTWQTSLDHFPNGCGDTFGANGYAIPLARGPLVEVTGISYVDADGDAQVLDPSAYLAETAAQPGRIWPAYQVPWPATQPGVNAVTVTYTAGYADAETFAAAEPALMEALRLLVGHYGNNREAVVVGTIASELPMAVQSLIGPLVVSG